MRHGSDYDETMDYRTHSNRCAVCGRNYTVHHDRCGCGEAMHYEDMVWPAQVQREMQRNESEVEHASH